MFVIRDIMFCKPGKVRPMVEKFKAISKLSEKVGWGAMKIMTDVSSETYWMLVSEREVPNLRDLEDMTSPPGATEADMKEFEKIMADYHDLVTHGRREIYKVEG